MPNPRQVGTYVTDVTAAGGQPGTSGILIPEMVLRSVSEVEIELEYTGERLIPEKAEADVFWEHISRYRFAARWVRDRRVLDIASGEGYGAASLRAAGAASIVGVDISSEACEYSRKKYQIDSRVGSTDEIPVRDSSVDVVVSFETLEHVSDAKKFVSECSRILDIGGIMILSTPNPLVYHQGIAPNPFHIRDWTACELQRLVSPQFEIKGLYGQCPAAGPLFSRWSVAISTASVWSRMPFVRSVVWRLRRAFSEETRDVALEDARNNCSAAINRKPSMIEQLFEPTTVREVSLAQADLCKYLVIVARKRDIFAPREAHSVRD